MRSENFHPAQPATDTATPPCEAGRAPQWQPQRPAMSGQTHRWRPRQHPRLLASLALSAALVAVTSLDAHAASNAGVFWTRTTLLRSFFAGCERVTWKRLEPTAAQRAALGRKLGKGVPAALTLYYGIKDGRLQGVAVIDDAPGQHLPITFGMQVSPSGQLQRLEVMAYREARGGEVRSPRFRRQFEGRSAADKLRLGHEIDAISGATISSGALTTGVRRNLALLDALLFAPGPETVLGLQAARPAEAAKR